MRGRSVGLDFRIHLSQRASYIGAIQADQTVESDHSDLLVQWGTRLPGHALLQRVERYHKTTKNIASSIELRRVNSTTEMSSSLIYDQEPHYYH
jgi:hypothetical protein